MLDDVRPRQAARVPDEAVRDVVPPLVRLDLVIDRSVAVDAGLRAVDAAQHLALRERGAELLRLRDSIDNIDAALIHLLAERFKCTQAVGEYKATHNLPPADPAREAAQIARLRQLAMDAKLDPDFAEKFLNFIVKEVIRHHEAIARNRT